MAYTTIYECDNCGVSDSLKTVPGTVLVPLSEWLVLGTELLCPECARTARAGAWDALSEVYEDKWDYDPHTNTVRAH